MARAFVMNPWPTTQLMTESTLFVDPNMMGLSVATSPSAEGTMWMGLEMTSCVGMCSPSVFLKYERNKAVNFGYTVLELSDVDFAQEEVDLEDPN